MLLILVWVGDIFKYDEYKKDANASLHIFNQLEMFNEWMMLNANTKTKLELRLTFVLTRDSWIFRSSFVSKLHKKGDIEFKLGQNKQERH